MCYSDVFLFEKSAELSVSVFKVTALKVDFMNFLENKRKQLPRLSFLYKRYLI